MQAMTTRPRLLITASFPKLIHRPILDFFSAGHVHLLSAAINVHPSLLPDYRGAAPIYHALLNRDRTTGSTIQTMSAGTMDRGAILSQAELDIHPTDNYLSLEARLAGLSSKLLTEALSNWPDVLSNKRPQVETVGSQLRTAPKIHKAQLMQVRWDTMSADRLLGIQSATYHKNWDLLVSHAGRTIRLSALESLCSSQLSSAERQRLAEAVSMAYGDAAPRFEGTFILSDDGLRLIIRTLGKSSQLLYMRNICYATAPRHKTMSVRDWWKGAILSRPRCFTASQSEDMTDHRKPFFGRFDDGPNSPHED